MNLFKVLEKIFKLSLFIFTYPFRNTPKSAFHPCLKLISLTVAAIFTWDTVVWSSPDFSPQRALHSSAESGNMAAASFIRDLQIPESLGTIEERYLPEEAGPRNLARTPMVIHIQDAHAHPEAQRNIQAILENLARGKKIGKVALEAAFGKIEPKAFHFFPVREANEAMMDHLAKMGELTGAELFALKQKGAQTEVYGVEDPDLYRKSYRLFQAVKSAKDQIQPVLAGYRRSLEQLEAGVFDEELRNFVQKRRLWEEKRDDSLEYFKLLNRLSIQYLHQDLTEPRYQFEWPNLTRLMKADQVEGGLKQEIARRELEDLIREIKAKITLGPKQNFLVTGIQKMAG